MGAVMARLPRIVDPRLPASREKAQDWPWSSARAHVARRDDGLISVAPLLDRVGRSADLDRHQSQTATALVRLRAAERTGRPLGSDDFLSAASNGKLGRRLRPRKPGPKPRTRQDGQLDMQLSEMGKACP